MTHTEPTTTTQGGAIAAALRENVRRGRMTADAMLKFLLDQNVHPRIATRLVGDALSGVDPDTDR